MTARNQAGREITLQSDPVEYTAALRAENQRLRLRLSECADELARLDRHGDNVTRQIRADARAALKGAE